MTEQISYGNDYKYIPATSIASGSGFEVLTDVYFQTIKIVNIVLCGHLNTHDFVLVDVGMPNSADEKAQGLVIKST